MRSFREAVLEHVWSGTSAVEEALRILGLL
jgi:hypothetical protein